MLTGYARKQNGPGDAFWTATQGGIVGASSGATGQSTNAVAVTFNAPIGPGLGLLTHFGLWDAVSGGNFLGSGPLVTQALVNAGDQAPSFPPGTLIVQRT